MPHSLSLRLSGDEISIRAVLSALRGMPAVDGMREPALDVPGQRDGSSSTGLSDDTQSGAQVVQLHIANSIAYDHVHGRVEILAAKAGVVVEWLEGE